MPDIARLLQTIYLLEWRLCSAQNKIAELEHARATIEQENQNLRYKAEDLEDALCAQKGEKNE
jgi:hypothetical protein